MKKHWSKIAIALGPTIIIASIVWEYARTNPDYNFLIEPWAIKGFEVEWSRFTAWDMGYPRTSGRGCQLMSGQSA